MAHNADLRRFDLLEDAKAKGGGPRAATGKRESDEDRVIDGIDVAGEFDSLALLAKATDIAARREIVLRHSAKLEIALEELTEATLDGWTPAVFPA